MLLDYRLLLDDDYCVFQEAVEEASMGNVDHETLTQQQLAVEKLIKDQNFNWKVCL